MSQPAKKTLSPWDFIRSYCIVCICQGSAQAKAPIAWFFPSYANLIFAIYAIFCFPFCRLGSFSNLPVLPSWCYWLHPHLLIFDPLFHHTITSPLIPDNWSVDFNKISYCLKINRLSFGQLSSLNQFQNFSSSCKCLQGFWKLKVTKVSVVLKRLQASENFAL